MSRVANILILFIVLLISNEIVGQVLYDTVPNKNEELIIGIGVPEELVIFKDFNEAWRYVKLSDSIQVNGRVIVSTVFGKNGKMKDTKIIHALNPTCDSIAFSITSNLKDWLPAMNRGRFVDMPFVFPIYFKNEEHKQNKGNKGNKGNKEQLFSATEKEYKERKRIFDFFYSTDSVNIVNDYNFFAKYLANSISEEYVYIFDYSKPKKKDRIIIELENLKENTKFFFG